MFKTFIPFLLVAFFIGMIAGVYFKKFTEKSITLKCPEMPTVNCPPNVTVQQLDMTDLKKIRGGFTYAPTYQGTIILSDSCK